MSNDLFSGLGDFFNQLFGAFGVGPQTDQPQQNPQQEADLFTQFFRALPDKGNQFAKNFQPPRQPAGWEDTPTLSSVVTAPFREDAQPRTPAPRMNVGAPVDPTVDPPRTPVTAPDPGTPQPAQAVPSKGSLVGEVRAFNGAKLMSEAQAVERSGEVHADAPDFRGRKGPASIRYNNPGAMWPGQSSRKFGAVQTVTLNDGQGNKIAVFPTVIHGAAAQFDLLDRKYTGKTLGSAIRTWSGGNSVPTYLKVIERETGLKPGTVITKEMMRDPRFAIPIAKAMSVQEAGRTYPMNDQQWLAAHRLFWPDKQTASK